MTRAATDLRLDKPEVSDDAIALLISHAWPGNIRELQNVVERMVLMSDGKTITADQLPQDIAGEDNQNARGQGDSSLWGYERAMIVKALQNNGWNQTKAARELGISRDNLRYRVKKYDITKPS